MEEWLRNKKRNVDKSSEKDLHLSLISLQLRIILFLQTSKLLPDEDYYITYKAASVLTKLNHNFHTLIPVVVATTYDMTTSFFYSPLYHYPMD